MTPTGSPSLCERSELMGTGGLLHLLQIASSRIGVAEVHIDERLVVEFVADHFLKCDKIRKLDL